MSAGAMLSVDPPAYGECSKKPLGLGELEGNICGDVPSVGTPRACIVKVPSALGKGAFPQACEQVARR